MKKLLSIVLVMAMLLSLAITIPVSADTTTETVSKWDGTLPATRYNFTTDPNATGNAGTTETNPYLITSAQDLANLVLAAKDGQTWGRYYLLTCDIDLCGYDWPGIGTESCDKAFSGIFKGNGHVIYNLSITRNDDNHSMYVGLFNHVVSGTIQDLSVMGEISVTNTATAGDVCVGGLIGIAGGKTTIKNCFVDVDITTSSLDVGGSYLINVGMLIGKVGTLNFASYRNGTIYITNCTVTGKVSSTCSKFDNVGVVGIRIRLTGTVNTETRYSDQKLNVSGCSVKYSVIRGKGHVQDRYGAFVGESNYSQDTFTNTTCELDVTVTSGSAPTTYVSGVYGVDWNSYTHTSTNCTKRIVVDTTALEGGTESVNPTPTKSNDGFTATTDEIKLTTTTMLSNNFAQNGIDENAGNIRFVSELGFSAGAFSKTGYVVEFATKSAEIGGKVVYTSLKAADAEAEGGYKTLTPTGKYYIAYGISDIPEDVSGTVTVTPYVVLLDGTTTVYGASAEYTITAGVLQQNS